MKKNHPELTLPRPYLGRLKNYHVKLQLNWETAGFYVKANSRAHARRKAERNIRISIGPGYKIRTI